MRKLLLLISLLSLCFTPFAQKLDWVAELKTGDNAYENVSFSISDGANGAYLWATTSEEVQFSSATGAIDNLQHSGDGSRGFNIIRVNALGEKVFSKYVNVTIGDNNGFLNTTSLVTDDQGNLFVLGQIGSSTTISIGETDINVEQEANAFNHAIILKISPEGELISYKLLQKEKEFVSYFLSADFFDGKLYVLYGLKDEVIDSGGAEFLFTHFIDVFDENWNLIQQRSFSGKTLNTGGGIEPRKAFLMSKVVVHDNNNVYLSGLIKNGQGSDLSEEIITEDNLSVSSVIKLDANLDFVWFRGVQGGVGNRYNTSLAILPHGDIVFNSAHSSFSESQPISLVGSSIEKREFPNQIRRSTLQVFLSSSGDLKYQSQINSTIIEQDFFLAGNDIYFPFYLSTRDQVNFYYDDDQIELKPESDFSSYIYGFIKFNQFGRYQSHGFFELNSQSSSVSDMQIVPKSACNSFLFLGRYGGDGESSINIDFQSSSANPLTNTNNTDNVFIASYSNQTPGLQIDEGQVYRSGNTISIPVSITDDSMADVTFFATSSDESVLSTDNYRLVNDKLGSRLVFQQTEEASGSVDLQLQLVDQCEGSDESIITLNLDELNDVPVFTSNPLTRVKESGQYIYGVSVSDPDGDELTLNAETLPDWITLYGKNAVVTYSGSGYSGLDNGRSVNATFNVPIGAAVDSEGNVYVADLFNHVIRKISNDGQVTTLAGTGSFGYSDGAADQAMFYEPSSLAIDSEGNLYVTDRENHVIRKISPAGDVSTFAGNGSQGYADGNGTNAQFNRPTEIAIDSDGNLYVTDQQNFRVRKITPDGTVTTLAGTGESGYIDGDGSVAQFSQLNGIAVDSNGNVYVSDYDNYRVRKISSTGTVSTLAGNSNRSVADGTGDQASFYAPAGMAVDMDGNVFIADQRYIRKISPSGEVSTIAGSDTSGNANGDGLSASFNEPHGVAIDSNGDLFVVEGANNLVRKIMLKDFTLVGDSEGQLGTHELSLKVTDTNGAFSYQDFTIEVFETDPPVFNSPENFQFDENLPLNEHAYAASSNDESEVTYSLGNSHDEALFNMDGQFSNAIYFNNSPDYENPQDANGDNVYTIEIIATDAFDNTASLLVNLTVNNVNESDPVISTAADLSIEENTTDITLIEATGFEDGFDVSFSKSGGTDMDAFFMTTDGQLSFRNAPDYEFPIDSDGDNVYQIEITAYVGERTSSKLFSVTVQDVFESTAPSIISEPLTNVNEGQDYNYSIIAEDPDNEDFTIELVNGPQWLSLNKDVYQVLTFAGNAVNEYGNGYRLVAGFDAPKDIVQDSEGNFFVLDANRVRKIKPNGEVVEFAGTGGLGSQNGSGDQASFRFPSSIAIDSDGNLYIADSENYLIRKISSSSREVSTIAGSGSSQHQDGIGVSASFVFPTGIAVDSNGNIYIADQLDHRIRKITPDGTVSTFAGTGTPGLLNGLASEAQFNGPTDIAIDSENNLYVTEYNNYTIRKITQSGEVSTLAGSTNSAIEDGLGENASFSRPNSIAVDDEGNLFVSDGHAIRKVSPEGTVVTLAGALQGYFQEGVGSQARFSGPKGIMAVNDNLYVADEGNRRIRKVSKGAILSGVTSGIFGEFDIELKVSDAEDGFNTQNFTITVRDNTPPVFKTIPANSFSQEVNFVESSIEPVYQATVEDDNPNGEVSFSIDSNYDGQFFNFDANGLLTFKESPDFDSPLDQYADNTYEVGIIAEDGFGNTANLLLYVKVTELGANIAPDFVTTPITQINDDEVYKYLVNGFDADGDVPTITAETIPGWLEFSTTPFGQVTTFAGTISSLIKNGPGAAASYNNPYGTAFDKEGNLYIADTGNNRIVKVSPDGVASTYVGTGVAGNAGGYRELALLNQPTDVAFDAVGNMYISDDGSSTVRKVNTEGDVSTLISFERAISSDTYTLESYERMYDVVVNSQGLIYLSSNNGIRLISPNGEIESFILNGNGFSSISDGIAIDPNDNVYFSDPVESQIKVITPEGSVSVFAGLGQPGYLDGEASQAKFENPSGLAYHPDGSILVSDAYYKIRKIDAQGNVTTIVNDIRDFSSSVILHLDVSSQGQIIALDFLQAEVFKVTESGSMEFFSGSYDRSPKNGPKEESTFTLPNDAVQDAEGNIYVSESHRIRKIDKDGIVTTFAGGTAGFIDGAANEAKFSFPSGLAFDNLGNLYVADGGNNAIRKIEPNGTVSTIAGNGNWGFKDGEALSAEFRSPMDLAIDDEGNIYVADQGNNRIRKISPQRIVSTLAGDGTYNLNPDDLNDPNVPAPSSVTLDNNGNIYFVVARSLIRKIGSDGSILTIAGNTLFGGIADGVGTAAKFQNPLGLITDDSGNIYVADNEFNAVRKVSTEGLVTTLAGAQTPGLEDKTGSQARFRGPSGLLLNSEGNLIVVDNGNHRLRELSLGNSVLSGSAVGQKGTYPVVLKITDESGASTTQSFEIEVIDVTAPLFTSPTQVEVEENTSGSFFQVEATDSNSLEYSLGTEKDESLFVIDIQTGELSFVSVPNFEDRQDFDQDNVYEIVVFASDGRNTSEQSISITVEDLDEVGPIVTLSSNSQGLVFTPSVTVNVSLTEEVTGLSAQSFTASNATITDFQGGGLAYSFVLNSLADGPASVKILENKVFDAAQNGNEASNLLSFNFEARNVAPTGITLSAAAVNENVSERVEVAILGVEDGDEADQHTFRLVGGDGDTDNAKFNIIGDKLFKRNEVSLDFEAQPTLSVRIQVSDIRGGSFTAVKTINVINIPEPSMSLNIVDATERELEVAGINFGRVKVGASQVRQLEVLNTSTDAELQVSEIKLSSGFTVSESIFTLGIGEKKVLNVTYLPQEPGVHLGKLELLTNAGNQSLSVAGSAFANKKPIAIAPEARITHIPGNILKLIGFDPDGDEIEFVITANPALGSLEAQSGLGEYKFIPSGLAPETIYEDELKFKVVEKNGGLSSDEATLKFRFRIRDVKHTLLPTEIVSVDEDNIKIVVSFTDEVINNDYYLTGFYRGKEEGQTVFFRNNLKINKGDLTNANGVLTAQVAVSRNDFPALFTNSKLLLAVKVKTANGFESSNTRIFTRSTEGQLNGNAVSDGSTDDGDFSVFALDSTVPENESVNINISAVEFGDFDFSGASLQITKSPANGTLGQPVLVSNQNGLAQWTVSYTSTTEIGIKDSFEFSVVHPVRNETLTGIAKIEVIGVPDAPELSAIADQQVNEDETLSFSIEASDVDSELSYSVISSESDISGTVSDGKLNITATNNFNGSAVIQLVVSEANETSPQSVSQSFNLTVLPVNDTPIVTSVSDQQVNEDGEISITLAATDPDGDTGAFSYSVSSDSDANVSYSIENGALILKPAADYNGVINFTVKANDGSGTATAISAGENFKLTIVPVNDVPEVSKAISTQTLIEGFVSYNLDLSKYFSDKETASSELVYSISNLTNVATSINGKLLVISSVSGNTGLQSATLTASDGELSVSQQITFVTSAPSADVTIANAITDLNLNEDFGLETVDLSAVFAYSLDANASFTYSLAGNQNVDALINGNSLEITSTENFNGNDLIYITATVDGKSNLTSFNINISPVNDAPTLVAALADESVLEDATFTKAISSSTFADIDGDALSYSASYNATWLSFDAATRTFSGTPENGDVGTVEVTVTAEDPSGAKATDIFQIVVSNTNDNPTNIGISASAFDENISVGTVVASLSGTDPDVGDTNFTYSLVSGTGDTDNASFQIVDGQLKTLSSINYEAKNSYSIRVKITDGFEGTFEKVFTISVNNVNEVATDITLATSSIAENQAVGAVIDGFATVDPDQGDTYSYSLVAGTGDTDNASFDIVSGQLVSKSEFNFEEKSSYSVRVKSTDAGGLSFEKAFTITVTDVNDAPTAVTSTTLQLPENSAIGTVIGQFSSADEDSADSHTYSLVTGEGDTDNTNFEFDGANLKAKASFNFETQSSYSIRVQSSDGNGGSVESQFTVNVTNVLEVELRTESSITVPTIGMGETETVELVLNNDGEDALEITGIAFPEAYSGSFTTVSIAGGGSETLTITFEPTEAGTYAGDITITSNAGTHVVSITGEAEIVAGIEEPILHAGLVKLYPNPASQFVEIDLTDLNGIPADLSIKSINGTSMWNLSDVKQPKVTIDISSYADGAYLILVQTDRGTVTKRLLIKK